MRVIARTTTTTIRQILSYALHYYDCPPSLIYKILIFCVRQWTSLCLLASRLLLVKVHLHSCHKDTTQSLCVHQLSKNILILYDIQHIEIICYFWIPGCKTKLLICHQTGTIFDYENNILPILIAWNLCQKIAYMLVKFKINLYFPF